GPGIEQRLGHRAIDHAGIEMTIAVMRRQPLAERTLARRRGSVDGDDHENSGAARARRSGRSSVKMLREANSAGLAKVRYSRIESSRAIHVNIEALRFAAKRIHHPYGFEL